MDAICAPLLNFIALTVCHIPRHYGLVGRLLDTIDVLLCNVNVCPTFSIAVSSVKNDLFGHQLYAMMIFCMYCSCVMFQVNRTVNTLLAITCDQNIVQGRNDFFLRRKAAQLLTRVRYSSKFHFTNIIIVKIGYYT